MHRRGFLVLASATVVLVALAIFALATGNRGARVAAAGAKALPALAPKLGDLAWVRLSHGAMTVNFARVGNSWLVVDKGNYPAAPGKIPQMLLALADLTLVEPKTQRPELYPRLEVDDPANGKSTLVAVQDTTGATVAELIVGKRNMDQFGAGSDGVYVRKPGDDRAWLARGKLDLSGDLPDWLDRRVLDIPDRRIASVALTAPDGTALVIARAAATDKFAVKDPPADAKFKSETVIAEPATALEALDLDDVKPAGDMPVPDSGIATAAFTTFDGLTVQLRLFRHDKLDWVAIDAAGAGPAAAAAKRIDDKVLHWTYAIPTYKAKMLRTTLAELLAPAKGS